MDLKKVFDQTVRDIKREVNKKVLKVPGIEQKVLDVTSNEPWGPHGSLMADIAQATRNYNEYQMIMAVLWKRVNDTGRNWRHVYKALTVLEYLVGHGAERVIDELREHAYQISTLSDFQYVDSSGKDQGMNVRKKAQSIVALINDKERIREVRQKAVANRDKYRGVSSTGGIYKPSSYSSTGGGYGSDNYDEDRYGSRYGGRGDDRNGYGRDREWDRYRDEDRYGKNRDSFSRDGDHYGRDGDRYRDDDYGGDRDHEDDRYNSRRGDRSLDGEKNHAYEDDDHYTSRNGGGRVDDYASNERRYERKQSGGKLGAPPSYEDSINDSQQPYADERDGGSLAATVAKASVQISSKSSSQDPSTSVENVANSASKPTVDFDDFDPRGSFKIAPTSVVEGAFFTPASESFAPPPNSVAIVPTSASAVPSAGASTNDPRSGADLFAESSFGSTFVPSVSAPSFENQHNGDPFGDSPFKASLTSSQGLFTAQTQGVMSVTSSLNTGNSEEPSAFTAVASKAGATSSFGFVDSLQGGAFDAFGTTVQPVQTSEVQPVQTLEPSNIFQTQRQPLALESTQSQFINGANFAKAQPQTTPQVTHTTAQGKSQQQKDKFDPKSTIWADTLSKGLIDLNISGPKTNPLADIGIDLDSLTRLERRREEKEKTSTLSGASTVHMGKAMGSGSGLGRAAASTLPPPASPMMGSMGMGMGLGGYGVGMGTGAGVGMGPRAGMAIGSGAGMGMGMGMAVGPGMGMNPGMGAPGMMMRPPMGIPPGSGMGVGVNPMMSMGMGGYGTQQQQYGGYR